MDVIQLYAAPAADLAPLDMKGSGYTAVPTNMSSGDWASGVGYTTDGVSKYIATSVLGTTTRYLQNSGSWGLKVTNAPASGTAFYSVGVSGSSPRTFLQWNTGGSMLWRAMTTGSSTTVGAATTGTYMFNRLSASQQSYSIDGAAQSAVSSTSAAPDTQEILIGRHGSNYVASTYAAFVIGGQTDDSMITSFHAGLGVYLS